MDPHAPVTTSPDVPSDGSADLPGDALDGPSDARRRPPETGDPAVDAALAELARLDELELARHPAVVDAVQAALADRLAEGD